MKRGVSMFDPGPPLRLALSFPRIDPNRGGAETYVADLCRLLVRWGHEVDVYTSEVAPGALPATVDVVHVPADGWNRFSRILGFARASERALRANESHYDCIVGFINTWHQDVIIPQGGLHPGSLAHNARRYPAGLRRAAYVLGKRANPKDWMYRAIERKQYDPARGSRVVAVSLLVRRHLEVFRGVETDRITVIPNAIDAHRLEVDEPAEARAEFREKLGLGESDLLALFVAHNPRLKGLPALLNGLARHKRLRPDARPVHLAVCGGEKVDVFARQARRLGLADTVHFLGFQDDIRPCFWGADLFIHPTYYDPCSLVVFEALACGLPVITTTSNGAGEVITPGVEGYILSSPEAGDELSDALAGLSDDRRRRAMSASARDLGHAQSFDVHLSRMVDLFREVAAAKRPTPSTPHFRSQPTRVAS
jgi:UDP-glucose:(heptosyl)LPS alpha-1,3-glucosyltransferase